MLPLAIALLEQLNLELELELDIAATTSGAYYYSDARFVVKFHLYTSSQEVQDQIQFCLSPTPVIAAGCARQLAS